MISAKWEIPTLKETSSNEINGPIGPADSSFDNLTSNLTGPSEPTQINTIIIDKSYKHENDPILSEFEKLLKKLSLELETNGVKNIYSHQPQLFYDSKGPVPFPKTLDLDDKSVKVQTNEIESLLAKYGITCPGAESVEISADSSDPFVTVITIKKTYF